MHSGYHENNKILLSKKLTCQSYPDLHHFLSFLLDIIFLVYYEMAGSSCPLIRKLPNTPSTTTPCDPRLASQPYAIFPTSIQSQQADMPVLSTPCDVFPTFTSFAGVFAGYHRALLFSPLDVINSKALFIHALEQVSQLMPHHQSQENHLARTCHPEIRFTTTALLHIRSRHSFEK
ncbi:hypothetical protein CVT24_009451 [Panaeolus cyanescens]|uniref:Uncharacterized protein n=1 Tax=Panaeolus cyanescens TaxID=181874 RepID=A0A409W3I8_9AGAR|nr:hypothetical protein CVT24_009451 [Panaeolus cyanescens]